MQFFASGTSPSNYSLQLDLEKKGCLSLSGLFPCQKKVWEERKVRTMGVHSLLCLHCVLRAVTYYACVFIYFTSTNVRKQKTKRVYIVHTCVVHNTCAHTYSRASTSFTCRSSIMHFRDLHHRTHGHVKKKKKKSKTQMMQSKIN